MHIYELLTLARKGDPKALTALGQGLDKGNDWLEAIVAYSHRFAVTRKEYTTLLGNQKTFPPYLLKQLETWQSLSGKPLRPGLSAVVRLKNDVEYVKAAILSIYAMVDEVVCVLNAPTDGTDLVVESMAKDLPKMSVHRYPTELEPAYVQGNYFQRVVANPNGSIAAFYNFSFSKASYSHVIKWDGDMIANEMCRNAFANARGRDVIFFDGTDLLGQQTTVPEPRIYRIQPGRFYVDTTHCEQLFLENSSPSLIREPLYIHMKLGKGLEYRKILGQPV